jgi:hypothetical protein
MSPVKEADPRAKGLEEAFAAGMGGPARPREAPPPPQVDRDAPHGREPDGTPKEPYGRNKDGSIRKSPAGRPRNDDRPRTAAIAEPAKGELSGTAKGISEPRDFSAALMDAGETIWFGGSVAAKIGPKLPLLGKFIPGRKLAATMAVFDAERPRLAAALNLAAQHDARARKLAIRLADGDAGWALSVMFMVAPFTSAVAAIWQGDKALAEHELPGLDELAGRNEAAWDRTLAKISAQMEAAQLAAQQQAAAEMQLVMAQNGQGGSGDDGGG